MKKKIISLLACGLLLSACAGRTPNPVPLHQPGDESLSCNALKLELMNNQTKITNLLVDGSIPSRPTSSIKDFHYSLNGPKKSLAELSCLVL